MPDHARDYTTSPASGSGAGAAGQGPRNFGAFLRTLGGRARSTSNYSGTSGSAVSTPAAKYETAESALSSLLGHKAPPASGPNPAPHDGFVNATWPAANVAAAIAASTEPQQQLVLSRRLSQAIKVDSLADPAEVWEASAALLDAKAKEVRSAGVEILKTCVHISNEETDDLSYPYERQLYYAAVQRHFEHKQDMTIPEMQALVAVLEALTRGGRDVSGLDGLIPLLAEIGLAMTAIRNRERLRNIDNLEVATAPLLDPTFSTSFVSLPIQAFHFSSDPKASPASLLIACHRFSFPHIPTEHVSTLLNAFVKRAMRSLGEHEITKTLELVDTIVKFGFIPVEHLEDIVKIVARSIGIEGRCTVIVVSPDGTKRTQKLSGDIPALAHRVMRNLLRSPANQALKCLRAVLSSRQTFSGQASCQTPLLVGAIRCLRRAFKDYEGTSGHIWGDSDRLNDRYPSLLAMGMTFLHQNFLDVLEWQSPEVDSEVLLFLEERFSFHSTAKTGLTLEEWEMVISILDKVTWRIPKWEEAAGQPWSMEAGSTSTTHRLVTESSKSEAAPATLSTSSISPAANANEIPILSVLDSLSLLLNRMISAQAVENFTGSHLRFFDFLLSIARHLSVSAINTLFNFYHARVLASPGRADWLVRLKGILTVFFPSIPSSRLRESVKSGRRSAMGLLQYAYGAAYGYSQHMSDLVEQVIAPFFERVLYTEKDPNIILIAFQMMQVYVKDCLDTSRDHDDRTRANMARVISIMEDLAWQIELPTAQETSQPSTAADTASRTPSNRSPSRPVSSPPASTIDVGLSATQALISLLYHCIIVADIPSAKLSVRIYRHLLALLSPVSLDKVQRAPASLKARFAALQCLTRLRADQRHRVWSRQHLEFDPVMLATIGKLQNKEPPSIDRKIESEVAGKVLEKERGRRLQRIEGNEPESSASRERRSSRSRVRSSGLSPPRGRTQLWTYPDALLFPFPKQSVRGVGSSGLVSFDHIQMRDWTEAIAEASSDYRASHTQDVDDGLVVLPTSEYLEVIMYCLESETSWELVSYILCALPNQIANKHFACGPECALQLQILRKALCDKLTKETLCEQVQLPPNVRRGDVHALAYQWLSTLIAYRDLYNREAQNETVVALLRGLSKTPNIAKPCVHALTMACYEFEKSMSKYLPEILDSLVRIMSTVNMPVHLLELVASIGHIKSLYANFTDDDYKKVFALAVQYLSSHYEALLEDPSSAMAPDDLLKAVAHAFKQYVFLLSYYVIALWYTVVPVSERARYTSFIVHRLMRATDGQKPMDTAAEVSLDMLARLAYSGASSGSADIVKSRFPPGRSKQKSWVVGNTVITLEGVEGDKEAECIVRRASGAQRVAVTLRQSINECDILQTLLDNRDRFQVAPSAQLDYPQHEQPAVFDADPAFFSIFLPPFSHINDHGLPLLVKESGQAKRNISVIDSMPHIDFHKVGVLYIGPNQTQEQEILRNVHGSRGYSAFLDKLGSLTRLQGYQSNTGGLDREMDFDGKWAYIWSDEIQQMIFHVATLMPTRIEQDPTCNYKKRHIGNDYVKIIYNDSAARIPFDILPGQFNFVNIIIEPHTPAGEAWRGASGIANNTEFFRVSLQQRPDMPEIGPLGPFKMVSTDSLSSFVRELALHANIFAQLFLQSVGVEGRSATRQRLEYASTWRTRLQAIKRLKEAVIADAVKETEGSTVYAE